MFALFFDAPIDKLLVAAFAIIVSSEVEVLKLIDPQYKVCDLVGFLILGKLMQVVVNA